MRRAPLSPCAHRRRLPAAYGAPWQFLGRSWACQWKAIWNHGAPATLPQAMGKPTLGGSTNLQRGSAERGTHHNLRDCPTQSLSSLVGQLASLQPHDTMIKIQINKQELVSLERLKDKTSEHFRCDAFSCKPTVRGFIDYPRTPCLNIDPCRSHCT